MSPPVSLLETELRQQPEAADRLLAALLPTLAQWRQRLRARGSRHLLLVARGSSDNAARYARYLWPVMSGLPVSLAAPSLNTVYERPVDLEGHAVVAISQSGESPDIVAVVEQARRSARPTIAITNDPASPLADAAEHVLDLRAGPERSVAATKTYTASLIAIAALGCALADPEEDGRSVEHLRRVPSALAATIEQVTGAEQAAELLAAHDRAVCVGRGVNMSTAFEAALKITELSGTLVAPYSPADLMHGPIAAVGSQVPAILVAPDEPASASVLQTRGELRRRDAPVVLLGAETDQQDAVLIRLPQLALPGWLSPLPCTVAAQLLAVHAARLRGVDLDRPSDLTKVTRTR